MMTRMFESQLGKSIKVYVDDMVVKSKVVFEHLEDLGSTFDVIRKHKLCLNASKCLFGVRSGKFLGYMVTHRGIEVDPDQIKAINDLKPATKCQGSPKAYWDDRRPESIHFQVAG